MATFEPMPTRHILSLIYGRIVLAAAALRMRQHTNMLKEVEAKVAHEPPGPEDRP